jgi:hypothetical protein
MQTSTRFARQTASSANDVQLVHEHVLELALTHPVPAQYNNSSVVSRRNITDFRDPVPQISHGLGPQK